MFSTCAETSIGVISRRECDTPSSAHVGLVFDHEPAKTRADIEGEDALPQTYNGHGGNGHGCNGSRAIHVGNDAGCSVSSACAQANVRTPPPRPMTPVEEDADSTESRFPCPAHTLAAPTNASGYRQQWPEGPPPCHPPKTPPPRSPRSPAAAPMPAPLSPHAIALFQPVQSRPGAVFGHMNRSKSHEAITCDAEPSPAHAPIARLGALSCKSPGFGSRNQVHWLDACDDGAGGKAAPVPMFKSVELSSMDDKKPYGSPLPYELQVKVSHGDFSPPLSSVRNFHTPRTDLTREEFTLAAIGITISMTDGDPCKYITAVQGGASMAGVQECDELVSINGIDVQEVNGFDCVELCQKAVRNAVTDCVTLGVRDFCSMQVKTVTVDMSSGGCPAMRILRQRSPETTSKRSPFGGGSPFSSPLTASRPRSAPSDPSAPLGSPYAAVTSQPSRPQSLHNFHDQSNFQSSGGRSNSGSGPCQSSDYSAPLGSPYTAVTALHAPSRPQSLGRCQSGGAGAAAYLPSLNSDDRAYDSRCSERSSETSLYSTSAAAYSDDDDVILHSAPRGAHRTLLSAAALPPRRASSELLRTLAHSGSNQSLRGAHLDVMSSTPESVGDRKNDDPQAAGWTWTMPRGFWWQVVTSFVLFALVLAVYMRSVGEEELATQLISSIDWIEGVLQTLPLCSCTYWIRGSILTVPLCRVCRPKVLRYHNYINTAGGSVTEQRNDLCDWRPSWLMGKCRRSTDTIKYLGKYGTYEECEAACVSYNVGKDRCRALSYYSKNFTNRKFHQTCFATTRTGWQKVRVIGVTTGRVLGPFSYFQRGLEFLREELRLRLLINWWDTGSPMNSILSMVLVIFGLSGIRRTPAALDVEDSLHPARLATVFF